MATAPLRTEAGPAERGASDRRLAWLVAGALVALGALLLPLDLPVTRWLTGGHLPKVLEKLIRLSEAFSHGFGAATILFAVFLLDRAHRGSMPRLVAGTVLGGALANVLKLLVSRTRPRNFDLHGAVLDSFSGWLSLGRLPSSQEGFPSAHAATGFALAVLLSWRYPAGRPLFFTLAAISGVQRVVSAAHFPSDVVFGAALGCLAGYACLPGGLLGRRFDPLEAHLASRAAAG